MYFLKVNLNPPIDGDDIQVTITVQYLNIKAGEGIPIIDSDTTEVETVYNKDETEEREETQEDDKMPQPNAPRTWSGRNVKLLDGLIAEMTAANGYEIQLTPAEVNYYAATKELRAFGLIGAGLGSGFLNAPKLPIMKFNKAMNKSNSLNCDKAVI
jgi:hypothetical protein